MKNTRKIACLLLLSLLPSCCLGCKKGASYTNTLTAREAATAVLERMDEEDFSNAEVGYLDDYFVAPEGVLDFVICIANDGNDLDEFGIWHMQENKATEIRSLLESYLRSSLDRNLAFYESYIPHEVSKLRDAEVHVFGDYAAYAIMDAEDRAEFFQELEKILIISN